MAYRELEFWRMVFNLRDSITPYVTFRVMVFTFISSVLTFFLDYFKFDNLPHNFVQYAGIATGILIVFRLNAGHHRWWEAREIWGAMLNHCRNLGLIVHSTYKHQPELRDYFLDVVSMAPHICKAFLRNEKGNKRVAKVLGKEREQEIFSVDHPLLELMRPFFEEINHRKREYSVHLKLMEKGNEIVDTIGACERILKTPVPLVAAIKIRRFITAYLITMPLGLYDVLGWFTPLFTMFLAYPFLSLDQMGRELENPFQVDRIGHLPLDAIADNIDKNVQAFKKAPKDSIRKTIPNFPFYDENSNDMVAGK